MRNRAGNIKNMPRFGDRNVVPVAYNIPQNSTERLDSQDIINRAPVEDDMIPFAQFRTNESHQKHIMSVNPYNITVDRQMHTEDFEPTSRAAKLVTSLDIDGGGEQEEFQTRKYVTKKYRGNNIKYMNVQPELEQLPLREQQLPPRVQLRDRGTQEFSAGYQTDTVVNNNPRVALPAKPTIDMINPIVMQDALQITHKSATDRQTLRRIVLQKYKQFGRQVEEAEVHNTLKVEALQKQKQILEAQYKIQQDAYEIHHQNKNIDLVDDDRRPVVTHQAPPQEYHNVTTKLNRDLEFKRTPSVQPNNYIRHDEINTVGRIKPMKKDLEFIPVTAENKSRITRDVPLVATKQQAVAPKLHAKPKVNNKLVVANDNYTVDNGIKWEKIGEKKQTVAPQKVDTDHVQITTNNENNNVKLEGKAPLVKNFHTIGHDIQNKLHSNLKPKTNKKMVREDRGKTFEDHVSFITVEDKKKGITSTRKDVQPATKLVEAVHDFEPGKERVEKQPVKITAQQQIFDGDDDLEISEQEVPLKISNNAQSNHVPIVEDVDDEPLQLSHPKQLFF